MSDFNTEYDNMSKKSPVSQESSSDFSMQLFPCVAGHGNILCGTDGTLYKIMDKSDNEYYIYKYGGTNYRSFFESFVPRLFERKQNLLKLQDVTYNFIKPHVMDIKVGGRKRNKIHTCKFFTIKGYTESNNFSFNPSQIINNTEKSLQLNNFLSKCKNKTNVINNWISKLKIMNQQLNTINLKLSGISLIFIYDEYEKENENIYMVDFTRVSQSDTYDSEVIKAIENLIISFEELLKLK